MNNNFEPEIGVNRVTSCHREHIFYKNVLRKHTPFCYTHSMLFLSTCLYAGQNEYEYFLKLIVIISIILLSLDVARRRHYRTPFNLSEMLLDLLKLLQDLFNPFEESHFCYFLNLLPSFS